MNKFILLSGAGIVGTLLRYMVVSMLLNKVPSSFPWSTFIVNICGSLFMGFIVEAFSFSSLSDASRVALTVGLLGAFTTYSAYAWEIILLFRYGYIFQGVSYIFLTNVVSCTLLGMGIFLARWIFGR